jgi:hypothetical protein
MATLNFGFKRNGQMYGYNPNAWKYVDKGQLIAASRTQSFLFTQCWDRLKNVKSVPERGAIFDKIVVQATETVFDKNVSLFDKDDKYVKGIRGVFVDIGKGQRLGVLKEIE